MRKLLTYLVPFIVLLTFANCKSQKENTVETIEQTNAIKNSDPDSLYASIERTACFGRCPVYKISIYNNGYSLYQGTRFVDLIGSYKTRLNKKQLAQIAQAAEEIGYFEMKDEYVNPALTDFPSCVTTLKVNGVRKRIKVYAEEPPQKLVAFQNGIDSLFKDSEWILIRKSGGLQD